jgi:hypothetical protein
MVAAKAMLRDEARAVRNARGRTKRLHEKRG